MDHAMNLTPILTLPDELLYNIFMQNTQFSFDLDWKKNSPLAITWHCTHVCRRWRRILLHAPSLWGRIIDLYALSWIKYEWQGEIMRRTGQAPLTVEGHLIIKKESVRALFLSILRYQWARVESLVVTTTEAHLIPEEDWICLFQPAPSLRRLVVLLDEDVHHTTLSDTSDGSKQLFDNHAPRLATLHYTHFKFKINLQASWLGHVRRLDISYVDSMSLTDWLEVMQRTQCLRYLKLSEAIPYAHDIRTPLSIFLPELCEIDLACPPRSWAVFLEQIVPKQSCKTRLADTFAEPRATVFFDEDELALTKKVLSRYSKYCFGHHDVSILSFLFVNGLFNFLGRQQASAYSFPRDDFAVGVASGRRNGSSLFSLLDSFSGCDFSSITAFEFQYYHDLASHNPPSDWDDHLSGLLSTLGHINSLATSPANIPTLQYMMFKHPVKFPLLRTVRIVHVYGAVDVGRLSKEACQSIFEFVGLLKDAGVPVETLDLGSWRGVDGLELFHCWADLTVICRPEGEYPFGFLDEGSITNSSSSM